MANVLAPAYTKSGAKTTTATKLDAAVFGVMPENHELLKLAYTAYLANGRGNLAQVKTRGLVRGGGRKPWKQKGTGRARFGSSRNPIWRGGGIVFGPTGEENYTKKIHTAAKRQAVRQALSLAANEGRIKVIETFETKEGKVAETMKLLQKLDVAGSVLLVVSEKDALVERATRNIQRLKAVNASYLNVFDILNSDTLILSQKSLETIDAWLGKKVTKPTTAKETQ